MKIRNLILLFFLIGSFQIGAQSPFNGVSVQEVAIDAVSLATIDASINSGTSARCWRVYACMDDPDWELQIIYGDNTAPWILSNTGTFYQAPLNGGPTAKTVNPIFYPFEPSSVYDSWYTIGRENNTSNTNYISTTGWAASFEAGGGFVVNDVVGSSIFGNWLPPFSEGRPDADNKVLIAQFTTDGIFTTTVNFQFRRLYPSGLVYSPVEVIQVNGVFVNGVPGSESDFCPIVFLPVELLTFDGVAKENTVHLNWTTISETNSDFFAVERSDDRENWSEITRLPGAGTTQLTNHYVALDSDPMDGMNYYRLRQTDINGHFEYSQTVPVKFEHSSSVEIYPNPAVDQFHVRGDLKNVSQLLMYTMEGMLITQMNPKEETFTVNLQNLNLESGVYLVQFVLKNGAIVTERLVVR